MKWSDGTRLEEVAATMVMRAAGFPVLKIISYGKHPYSPHAPISILMTRVPGRGLGEVDVWKEMKDEERETLFRAPSHARGYEKLVSYLGWTMYLFRSRDRNQKRAHPQSFGRSMRVRI